MRKIIDVILENLQKHNFKIQASVPAKVLMLSYTESQTIFGITLRFSVYNSSNGHTFTCFAKLENDYYGESRINCKFIKKTIESNSINDYIVSLNNLHVGKSQEVFTVFNEIKSYFYDPHVKIPVPPKL